MHLPFPVLTAQDAAAMIKHGQTVGFSAFTPAGSAKAIPRAIAERAKTEHAAGRSYQIRVLTGASTGESLDGALASANAISFRAPWQNDKTLRALINSRQVPYLDMHGAMHVRLRNRAHRHPRDTGSDHRRYSFLPAASPFASAGDLKQPGDRPPPGNHLHQHRTRGRPLWQRQLDAPHGHAVDEWNRWLGRLHEKCLHFDLHMPVGGEEREDFNHRTAGNALGSFRTF